jgi:hypothetical protein
MLIEPSIRSKALSTNEFCYTSCFQATLCKTDGSAQACASSSNDNRAANPLASIHTQWFAKETHS